MHVMLFLFVCTFQRIHFYPDQILQSIYFILFVWTFERRLSSQTGVVVCLFYFICQHFPTIYFNPCTGQDLSYICQVDSRWPSFYINPHHFCNNLLWPHASCRILVATVSEPSRWDVKTKLEWWAILPSYTRGGVSIWPSTFSVSQGKIIASNPSCWEGPNLTTFDRVRTYAIACRKGPSLTTRIAIAQIHVLQCTGQQTSMLFWKLHGRLLFDTRISNTICDSCMVRWHPWNALTMY